MSLAGDDRIIDACGGGVPLAIDEGDETHSIWPRLVYRTADDALDGVVDLGGMTWFERDALRVRLVWAHRITNHPEGSWWLWTTHPGLLPEFDPDWPERELEGPPIECWEVRP